MKSLIVWLTTLGIVAFAAFGAISDGSTSASAGGDDSGCGTESPAPTPVTELPPAFSGDDSDDDSDDDLSLLF